MESAEERDAVCIAGATVKGKRGGATQALWCLDGPTINSRMSDKELQSLACSLLGLALLQFSLFALPHSSILEWKHLVYVIAFWNCVTCF